MSIATLELGIVHINVVDCKTDNFLEHPVSHVVLKFQRYNSQYWIIAYWHDEAGKWHQ